MEDHCKSRPTPIASSTMCSNYDEGWSLLYRWRGTDAELIDSSGEPWRLLSKFIITDNPYVRNRSSVDIEELVQRKEKYRLEYAKRQ